MLRKFRIKTRLLVSFFIAVFFTLLVGITGYISLTSIGNMAVRTIHNVKILNNIHSLNTRIDAGVYNMLYTRDATLARYVVLTTREQTENLLTLLREYLEIQDQFSDIFTPGEMQNIANLLEIFEETYVPVLNEIFDLVEQGNRYEALSLSINRRNPIANSLTHYISTAFNKNLEHSEILTAENNRIALFRASVMLALVVIAFIVSVMLALVITRSIAIPLSELGKAAEKVAMGKIDIQFEQSKSNDEIAFLSRRLQETIQQLKQVQQLKIDAIVALHEREKAEAASKSKGEFLAKMSHEIRTPMNAITGMSELLLRRELPDDARSYAYDIKQAASSLISIINDILDFSKIEAGKLEIVPVSYMLSSLVNDTVNIIRMRLMEKQVRFFTNIDGSIPNNLFGDEVRLRQIILNLLSNAAKYTEKGHISMSITIDKQDDDKIWLKIVITDTGMGIKPEDQIKLFEKFVQFDAKKNRNIEGTGLGLAITKQLCAAMGGNISMTSEYGKGSDFIAIIPQIAESKVPFAAVEKPYRKKVLVYDGRTIYGKSVCWSLDNLGVPNTMVTSQDDFAKALAEEEWFFVFSGYGLYNIIKPIMETTNFPNGKKPSLALMVDRGTEDYIPDVNFVSIPIQSLSIANVLNGKSDRQDFFDSFAIGNIRRFTFQTVRILIVDDIATNLKVAEGLLAPYKTTITTCLSGAEAIEQVKLHEYDLVFMDHMMPGMDGIETTAAIRALEGERFKTLPIVALTANAVSGMREMFLEKGFSDFLAKPIDISKLDEILGRWIPKEKRVYGAADANQFAGNAKQEAGNSGQDPDMPAGNLCSAALARLEIPGVDMQRGITMTGGTIELYRQVLALFRKDAEERLPLLQTISGADALPAFITQIHALKSASASIGAAEVSGKAAELEAAGKAKDLAFIEKNLGSFVKQLTALVRNIQAALEISNEQLAESKIQPGNSLLTAHYSLITDLLKALESKKIDDIDRILEEIKEQAKQQSPDTKTIEILEKISDYILMTEFDSAAEAIRSILKGAAHGN
ncbi:MAG: ATP-binding protein [Spirochaetes bacterium]|nr:ATP-binding protein [Spirochaetota bacterium]